MTTFDMNAELLASLKEMLTACAACFRVIATVPGLADMLEDELITAGVREGFAVRSKDAIVRAERKR